MYYPADNADTEAADTADTEAGDTADTEAADTADTEAADTGTTATETTMMGTDPLNSKGMGLGIEPTLGPSLEEMKAAGPRATRLWGQEVKSEGKKPRSGATTKAEVVAAVSSPPGQGGSRWEEGTPTMADYIEEEGEEKEGEILGPEEQEPLLGLSSSAASVPLDLGGPRPILESNEEAGHGLPLGSNTGAEPPVGTFKDVNKEKETTKQEVVLELCCIQVDEALEEVECPICMKAEESEGEEKEVTGEEVTEELEEEGSTVALESCCLPMEEPPEEPECPICTEPYDQEAHRPAPLNCSHVLCGRCLRAIMEAGSAADIGRVRCPICRQKTPMMEWEICRLQEELLLLGASEGPTEVTPMAASMLFHPLPPRRPGFWGGLEHRFRVRFLTSRTVGCLPCLRYPPGLVQRLEHMEGHCRWGYRLALLALTAADALSLLLVFLPIALLLLLFLIMDQ